MLQTCDGHYPNTYHQNIAFESSDKKFCPLCWEIRDRRETERDLMEVRARLIDVRHGRFLLFTEGVSQCE
jgi:hypothetical protein